MARNTQRHLLHLTSASAVVTALVMAAGPVAALPATSARGAAGPGVLAPSGLPARTPPPPPPSPPASPGPSTPPGPSPPNPPPPPPSPPSSETSETSGTPGTGKPSGPSKGGAPAGAALKQQKDDVGNVTADLNEKKQDVPDALVPSVEQLSTVLQTVNDDRTPPQERDGALRTARQVTSALEVISDPGTPQAARRQLTGLVKQLTSTLDVANSPRTSPEEGRVLTLLADRSASALRAFGAPETPPALAADLAATLQNLLPQSAEDVAANASIPVRLRETVAAAVQAASDPRNGDDERKGLAQSAHETSSSWHDRGSSGSSDDKRRLEKQLKEAAAAQGLPDETLGKAAAACTNTLFELVSDATLAKELRSLTPDTWNSQGVQDFWKSREEANDSLDVYAQLQNHKVDDTSLAIRRLLPRLSDAVSADDLISTVGPPALHCLQAALELDRDAGVSSGSWVSAAEQI